MKRDFRKKTRNLLSLLSRIRARAVSKSPFTNEEDKRLLVHCCHHKVGTAWFSNVLNAIANEYGLRMQICEQNELRTNTDIFIQNHSRVNFSKLSPYYASHMIRDPRDTIISAYYYHLWTHEDWANKPMSSFTSDMRVKWALISFEDAGDLTYKQYLNTFSREDGIMIEIKRCATTIIKEMIDWDYNNPKVFEIKYEDIIINEDEVFSNLFRHYGFSEPAVKRSVEIARKYSFRIISKRKLGEVKEKSHIRSGKPGQWKDEFNKEHKEYFKKLLGEELILLGYEKNLEW